MEEGIEIYIDSLMTSDLLAGAIAPFETARLIYSIKLIGISN